MVYKTGKSRRLRKGGLLFALWLVAPLTFWLRSTVVSETPVQDRYFDGSFVCSCWHDGTFELGCGFSCYYPGDDCYEYSYCFCPCYE